MKTWIPSIVIVIVFISISLFVSNCCYINTTASLPYGLYLKTNKDIDKGSFVVFVPSKEQSKIVKKYTQDVLIKRVAFIGGEKFIIPLASEFDSKGRKIDSFKPKTNKVPDDSFFVLGDSIYSLDSRYLGFIKNNQVIDVVRPFITWRI